MRASQAAGSSSSAQRGQQLGRRPGAVERRRPLPLDDRVAERACRPRTGAASARGRAGARAAATTGGRSRAAAVQRRAQRRQERSSGAPAASMTCSAWPSTSGHRRLDAVEQSPCARPRTSVDEAAVAQPRPTSVRGRRAWAGAAARVGSTLTSSDASSSRSRPARCSRSHGTARELDGMGDLVDADPGEQLARGRRRSSRGRVAEVRRDEQQPRGRLRVERATSSYWPEDAPAHEPDERRRPRPPEQLAGARAAPASAPGPCPAAARRAGRASRRIVARFARAHAGAVDGLGRRERRARAAAPCRR